LTVTTPFLDRPEYSLFLARRHHHPIFISLLSHRYSPFNFGLNDDTYVGMERCAVADLTLPGGDCRQIRSAQPE